MKREIKNTSVIIEGRAYSVKYEMDTDGVNFTVISITRNGRIYFNGKTDLFSYDGWTNILNQIKKTQTIN